MDNRWVLSVQIFFLQLLYDILPVSTSCIDRSTNSTVDCTPALPSQTPYPPPTDSQPRQESTYSVFYAAAIFLGVVGIPMVILFRICWIRRLNAQQRSYGSQRHRTNDVNGNQHAFTVHVDPAGYLPSYEQSIADSPPPYEVLDLPPAYKLKKDKSSASLPSYCVEDNNVPSTTHSSSETNTSRPVETEGNNIPNSARSRCETNTSHPVETEANNVPSTTHSSRESNTSHPTEEQNRTSLPVTNETESHR